MDTQDLGKWTESIVKEFIANSSENTLQNVEGDKAWAEPLVGFSNGADPIFEAYRDYVGPFHLTPLELFNKTFPTVKVGAEELTVISWILPQTEKTKADNRKETLYPSERWARARIYGEEVNKKVRQHVVAVLEKSEYKALAPQLSPHWERKESDRFGFASNWSERHAAYACGLGTFGLSDGLITPRGKAMRCGSVIANIPIPASERPYQNHNEYCLFLTEGKCGICMKRCPAEAITEAGHDKVKCRKYIRSVITDYLKSQYQLKGYGCGLCQTKVPCESKIPTMDDL